MPIEISSAALTLLTRPVLGRLATASREGQPHVVPVWFLWEDDLLWISSFSSTRKNIDLQQNPKCAIVIDLEQAADGLTAVMLEGRAELVSEPRQAVHERIERIYAKYLGPEGLLEPDPQSWLNSPENLLIQFTPTRMKTW
jgi:PPOX class probable F420-dependent enzyme